MGSKRNSPKIIDDNMKDDWDGSPLESEAKIKDFLLKKFYLIWDLGDEWVFSITYEKVIPEKKNAWRVLSTQGIFDPDVLLGRVEEDDY